jgi:hypothetical protein
MDIVEFLKCKGAVWADTRDITVSHADALRYREAAAELATLRARLAVVEGALRKIAQEPGYVIVGDEREEWLELSAVSCRRIARRALGGTDGQA